MTNIQKQPIITDNTNMHMEQQGQYMNSVRMDWKQHPIIQSQTVCVMQFTVKKLEKMENTMQSIH